MHKELNAYPNYGQNDGAADILYVDEVGAWTFAVPPGNIVSATVVASVVADDAGQYPASEYTFELWSSGCSYVSAGQLPHGAPFDSRFTNWVQLTYPAAPVPSATYVVTMKDTSLLQATEWIAVDWIELHVTTH